MKTYTIGNMKGGVGKTTTTVNLAYSFSLMDQRVLVVDLDTQCNATPFFAKVNSQGRTVKDIFDSQGKFRAYHTKYSNIDILRGSQTMFSVQDEWILKKALETVGGQYDICLIDTHPVFDNLTLNAIYASDIFLTPIKFDNYCRNNLALVEDAYHKYLDINPDLKWFVFANMVANTKAQKTASVDLLEKHNYPMLDTCISRSAVVDNALNIYKPVMKHRSRSNVAVDFIELAKELLGK